jgi:glycerophosphoryl diester phosphodiesterase
MRNLWMLIMLITLAACQSRRFDIIAHRGLPRLYPEHTLKGLQEALKFNVDYVEPDVVLTKDNIPVVLHDTHIDTTTDVKKRFPKRVRKDGRFYAIDFTIKEIKSLKANHRIDLKSGKPAIATRVPVKNSPYSVPTLEEFIHVVHQYNLEKGTNTGIYIEIKAPAFHKDSGKDITAIVHNILEKAYEADPTTPIIVQCFDDAPLKRLRKEGSPFKLVQLIAENSWGESRIDYNAMRTKAGLKEVATYADGVGPWIPMLVRPGKEKKMVSNDFVNWAHNAGLLVHPYTLRNDQLPPFVKNEKEALDFLIKELDVDGIFTDNVNTTVKLLD